jgi:non-specific protein-tyrosine kinase
MELRTYIAILRRRKWIIIFTTIFMTTLAGVYSYMATPMYSSSITVRVATISAGGIGGSYTDVVYNDRLINTYARMVGSGNTKGEIAQELGMSAPPRLSVEVIPNTELLRITAEAPTPEMAQQIAALAAQILISRNRELYASEGQSSQEILQQQIKQIETELASLRTEYDRLASDNQANTTEGEAAARAVALREQTYASLVDQYEKARLNETLRANAVSVVDPAYLPVTPSKPRTKLNLILGALAGLFAGIALAFLVDNLDTTLYTPGQIKSAIQLPVVGRIPAISGPVVDFDLVSDNGYHPEMEAFRRLRISLLSSGPNGSSRTFVITSAGPDEGKSTVTANLAASIAKSGRSVVVVDADLHVPAQHQIFSLDNDRGLTTILTRQANAAGVVRTTLVPNLYVITSGPNLPEYTETAPGLAPSALTDQLMRGTELLGTPLMEALVNELSENYDIVLFDSPAMLTVTDAAVLAPLVDKVVVVVASERVKRDSLRMVREQLANVHARDVVVVINQDREQAKAYSKARRAVV